MKLSLWFAITAVATFSITAILLKFLIPKLKSHKMGQKILDIGPRWHKNKEGTPTMGGISFVFATTVVALVCLAVTYAAGDLTDLAVPLLTLGFAVLNGCIGFVDDYTKFIKKQNEGLTALQKYALQAIAAGLYLLGMTLVGAISTELYIPFAAVTWDLGIVYYLLALLLLTGLVNAVNLTDGIDGLAGSVTFVVAAFFGLLSVLLSNVGGGILSGCLMGGCLGFLLYNFHPARVFMGDTGSLFLGGLVVGLSFLVGNPLLVLLCGIVYVCETGSVILQVLYFKLTKGKRLFKMSPIHHHFEKCGWGEVKIVSIFTLVTLVFSAIALLGSGILF